MYKSKAYHKKMPISKLGSIEKKNTTPFILTDEYYSVIDIQAKLLEDRIVILSGEVNDYICDIIRSQLLYLEQQDPDADITMYINSPGGSVYSGLGLIDTMDFISNDICTINTGLCASMAAVILACGAKGKRRGLKRSRVMIHQPLGYGYGRSQASDMEIDTREILSLKKELYEIVSEKTGNSYDKVHEDSDRDYWMNSTDAVNYGIIDSIVQSRKKSIK